MYLAWYCLKIPSGLIDSTPLLFINKGITNMESNKNNKAAVSIGAAVAIGVAIGVALNNVAMGVSIGVALGVAFYATAKNKSK